MAGYIICNWNLYKTPPPQKLPCKISDKKWEIDSKRVAVIDKVMLGKDTTNYLHVMIMLLLLRYGKMSTMANTL